MVELSSLELHTTSTRLAVTPRSPRRRPRVRFNAAFVCAIPVSNRFVLPADAAKISHEVRDHIPGATKEVKKDAESAAAQAQSKFNQLGRDAKAEASKVDDKLQQYRAEGSKQLDAAGKEINKGIVSIQQGGRWQNGACDCSGNPACSSHLDIRASNIY